MSYLCYDFLSSIVTGKVDKFAIPYTLSTIFTIMASLFLFNPRNSCGRMMEKKRILITLCYFGSIFMTLFCALYLKFQHLTFLFLIIQNLTWIWYLLSYVPHGHEYLIKFCSCCFKEITKKWSGGREDENREELWIGIISLKDDYQLYSYSDNKGRKGRL